MAKTEKSTTSSHWQHLKERGIREGGMIALLALAAYLGLALFSYYPKDPGWSYVGHDLTVHNMAGPSGAWIANVMMSLVGDLSYILPLVLIYRAWSLFHDRHDEKKWSGLVFAVRLLGSIILMLSGAGLASLHFPSTNPATAGGFLGQWISDIFFSSFNLVGSTLILVAAFMFSLTVATNLSWLKVMETLGGVVLWLSERVVSRIRVWKSNRQEAAYSRNALEQRKATLEVALQKKEQKKPPKIQPMKPKPEPSQRAVKEKQPSLFDSSSLAQLPSLGLLTQPDANRKSGYSKESLEAMSRLLEIKLKDFGVEAEVVSVAPGPVITRFEIQPAAGVKVSKISNLAKDLARSMAMTSVRVVEIIPGKTTVGIEVPNENRAIVHLSEVLSSAIYDRSHSVLTMGLGHDIGGTPVVADLAKMPHLLVAGTTGSGKSVGVNAMLISLLYKATPEQVRLILVDPKMLELSVYDGIPHLLTPVVTDMSDAANALRWCVAEMERRYKLMAAVGVRNIAGFNKKIKEAEAQGDAIKDPLWKAEDHIEGETAPALESLPFIVVVIDEFADMMMIVGKKVEELIARLAQKARAAGVHLILATQRPSVDVITGLIKANVPTRIAFQVSSKIDSRTILDQGGAEQLLGHGDMLYMPPGTSYLERVHGAFVSDEEVHSVVGEWKQKGQPVYIDEITDGGSDDSIPGMTLSGGDYEGEADAFFDEAVAFVTQTRKVSASSLQRKFRIGYNRAARLVESMEEAGIVSSAGHNGNREVLAPPPPE
ncbi:DNA translocase FtsK [Gynuella sp.]|uniref:DNA translocase FtsK n=1 Tax=Gynuella sp. TaxID=2969146 RepID=UPI003D0E8047